MTQLGEKQLVGEQQLNVMEDNGELNDPENQDAGAPPDEHDEGEGVELPMMDIKKSHDHEAEDDVDLQMMDTNRALNTDQDKQGSNEEVSSGPKGVPKKILLQLDKKQPWRFFDNQMQNPEALFQTYGLDEESWMDKLAEEYQQKIKDVDRANFNIVKSEETYEPNMLSYEMTDWIKEERKQLRKQQESNPDAGYDCFEVLKKKEFEAFQALFHSEEEDEDGNVSRNFKEHSFPAFESGNCEKHRNEIELFSFNEEYLIVSKSFVHKKANSRLRMRIFKIKPTMFDGETVDRPYMAHEVEWPIVDSSTCFDPAMISVVQWRNFLYFVKVENQQNNPDATTIFRLCKFDMVTDKESEVREIPFMWEDEEQEGEEFKTEKSDSQDLSNSQTMEEKSEYKAYAAIFLKVGSAQCQDEEEFVNRRMLSLLFEYPYEDDPRRLNDMEKDETDFVNKPDRNFVFKIRRVAHFQNDLYYNQSPIPTNKQFRFQYFMDTSLIQRQAFALINEDLITVVPVDLNEVQTVTKKEYYHYPDRDCSCCNDKKKEISVKLREIYLRSFKVLESFNIRGEEEYRLLEIKQSKMDTLNNMIRHLEGKDANHLDEKRDNVMIILDKRTHRYIFFMNIVNNQRDYIKIYESYPKNSIRNAFNYDANRLQPFARYDFHERDKFLSGIGEKRRTFNIRKQMLEVFPNVIVEARTDNDGKDQFVVAVAQQNPTPQGEGTITGSDGMFIGLDKEKKFIHCFDNIYTDQQVDFIQVAWDDRMVVPRIYKDEDRQQFMFQLYHYKGPEEDDLAQSETILENRQKPKDVASRVIEEVALDLSTSFMEFQNTTAYLTPCTSIYRQNFGQTAREYVQDFQALVYQRNCQIIRIFQYRVFYQLQKGNKEMPYSARTNLVGMKILIVRPTDSLEKCGFYSLFDDNMEIIGTQFILTNSLIFDMPNFEREEWAFSSDIVMSGFMFYYNQDNLDEECLLMQAGLSEVLNARPEFTESDHSMLLKMQIRILMNIVPYGLDMLLVYDINESNFLQPIELLKTQSLLSFVLDDPGYVSDMLKALTNTRRDQPSLFEFFIKELNEEERAQLLAEDYYIPRQEELSRDLMCCNPLLRCFEPAIPMNAVLEKILEYMFSRPYSKNQSMLFMEIMPLMLQQSESSNEFAKFFIDSSKAQINFNKIGSRLTIMINHPDLPRYSNKAVTINEFTDQTSLSSQTDVNKWMQQHLITNRVINETTNVAVRHFYIDFRVLNLGFKLDQFRGGSEIQVSDISDYDLASYLIRICKVYGKDIEYQDSTRNIIDDMFITVKPFFNFMLFYWVILIFVPLTCQIFVFDSLYLQRALSVLTLWSLLMYFVLMLGLIVYQKADYFFKYNNLLDLSIFIIYLIYFGLKNNDLRIYLPEKILADGDFEFRRLAKGGGGGGGGKGSGSAGSGAQGGSLREDTDPINLSSQDFFGNVFDFELRTIGRITFQAFLHTLIVIVSALKFINLLQIYDSFQTLIMVLRFTIKQSIPFWALLYLWILLSSLMFRILGGEAAGNIDGVDEYPFFGVFFDSFMNTYKMALGNNMIMQYPIWQKLELQEPSASRFAAILIWITWLVNNFAIFIFGLNFLVSLISQGYEEALYYSRLEQYIFRCEKVLEATVLTKMLKQGRTLQTFSLSITSETVDQSWPGVVKSIKNYIRDQNISLKTSLFSKIESVETSVNKKAECIQNDVQEMRQQLSYVNESLSQKLEGLADSFNNISVFLNQGGGTGSRLSVMNSKRNLLRKNSKI